MTEASAMLAARRRLPALVLEELRGSDWTLENGARHWHLRIGGRLVSVIPRGIIPDSKRGWLKVRGDICRFCKRMEGAAS
jgi:hypothetical protein